MHYVFVSLSTIWLVGEVNCWVGGCLSNKLNSPHFLVIDGKQSLTPFLLFCFLYPFNYCKTLNRGSSPSINLFILLLVAFFLFTLAAGQQSDDDDVDVTVMMGSNSKIGYFVCFINSVLSSFHSLSLFTA